MRGYGTERDDIAGGRPLPWPMLALLGSFGAFCLPAAAEPAFGLSSLLGGPDAGVAAARISLVLGLVLFSTVAVALHLGERRRERAHLNAFLGELTSLRARHDRVELFLAADPWVGILWRGADADPEIAGDLGLVVSRPGEGQLLDFTSWLPPDVAHLLEARVASLRHRGEGFRLTAMSSAGRSLEIVGRPVNGCAVLRIRNASDDRRDVIRIEQLLRRTACELEAARAMLDAVTTPAWARDGNDRLVWVNAAYARAVEARDPADAVARGLEFLESPVRDASAASRAAGRTWRGRAPLVVVGERKLFDIVDVPGQSTCAGMATDVSEIESLRADLERAIASHSRTLDQLSTAVAIFDKSQRLVFHNAAYRQLWGLDQGWLEQAPTDSEVLDRLRIARLLPEQFDYRAWKSELLSAYHALESEERPWHLPDGRSLRVVVNPNPRGGVTYLFDDLTERLRLEAKFNALLRVQGETLDALKEAVAVFGSDGRLELFNPAFAALWSLGMENLAGRPHIDRIARLCVPSFGNEDVWAELCAIVAGWRDQRMGWDRRLALQDGRVLDCTASPLPDGATLLTFIDMTASVNIERALTERNQALVEAQKLRDDFVHHVSYELRSPLTNIIGFIQFLGDPVIGTLNEKQREYAGYAVQSSQALLAIIDGILDLASIDADVMELSLEDVDIVRTIEAAAEGVRDRLTESRLDLRVEGTDGAGTFVADGKRILQILFNLLSNAIGFSSPGQVVTLSARRDAETIRFTVSDRGRGIPDDVIGHVFERFKTHTVGSRHRGVGLGLSIVRAFTELHGGSIGIETAPGEGTTVTCIFPALGPPVREPAPEVRDRAGFDEKVTPDHRL